MSVESVPNKHIIHKIPELTVGLQLDLKREQRSISGGSAIFGQRELREIERLRTQVVQPEDVEQRCAEVIVQSRGLLEQRIREDETKVSVLEFFIESINDPELKPRFLQLMEQDPNFSDGVMEANDGVRDEKDIIIAFEHYLSGFVKVFRAIPDDLYLDMLSLHYCNFVEKQDCFKKRYVPRIKRSLIKQVEKAVNDGKLPVSLERVIGRVQGLKMILIDGLLPTSQKSVSVLSLGIICLDDRNNFEIDNFGKRKFVWVSRKRRAYHELVHACVAGKTIVQLDKPDIEDQAGKTEYIFLRSGLHFAPKNRFEWLDEMITEYIATMLTGIDAPLRLAEKTIANLVLAKISMGLALQAYCEDYANVDELGQPILPEDTIPRWREFYHAVGKAFADPQILVKIDKYYQAEDLNGLIQILPELNAILGNSKENG